MKLRQIFSRMQVNHSRRFLMVALSMVVAIIVCPAKACAQPGITIWTNRYNGGENIPNAVAVDGAGNVFVAVTSVGSGSYYDYATIKYSSSGVALWTNRYNGPGNNQDGANAVTVDGSGNVFVTGSSRDSRSYDSFATLAYSGVGVPLWTNRYKGPNLNGSAQAVAVDGSGNVLVTGFLAGSGSSDYATVKYSGAGVALWTNRYNGPGNGYDIPNAVAVDGSGNVFVTGYSIGSGSSNDYVTIKYSSAGVELWVARYNGPGNDYDGANAVAVDGSGNVFVTGYSIGSGSSWDYATIKYSGAGVPVWTNRYNGPGNNQDAAYAMAVDGGGNVFVTGSSRDSGSYDDYATIKYSGAGLPLWTNRYNGPGNGYDDAQAVAVDGSGNVFVTGVSWGNGGSFDYATIAYSGAGVPLWANRYNGPGNDYDYAHAVAVDGKGDVFVTGYSIGSSGSYDYATIKIQGSMAQLPHNASLQTLPDYQYDGASGRHAIRDLHASGVGQFSFVFATGDLGARCLVSWTTTLREWFPLIHFDASTVGTKITDSTPAQQTFYRTTYLPTGVLPAHDFDYPIGNGGYDANNKPIVPDGIPEQIVPERNSLYPANPVEDPDRGAQSPGAGWYNAQDVGSYYPDSVLGGGLHPGEDWNKGSAGADVGEGVRCVANGNVIAIKPAYSAGPAAAGYVMVIRHWLLNGEAVDSIYVHIAPDRIAGAANRDGVIGTESNFTYQEGAAVTKGNIIGVIGAVTSVPSHLHFEMRKKSADPDDLWPNDTGNGYYGAVPGLGGRRGPTISQEDTTSAFGLMALDGIIDPSDFIDDHRPSQ